MVKFETEDHCVGCGDGCHGCGLNRVQVAHYYCDECEYEFEPSDLYIYKDRQLCEDCILGQLPKVEV